MECVVVSSIDEWQETILSDDVDHVYGILQTMKENAPYKGSQQYVYKARVVEAARVKYGTKWIVEKTAETVFTTWPSSAYHAKLLAACLFHGYESYALEILSKYENIGIASCLKSAMTMWDTDFRRAWVDKNGDAYFSTFTSVYKCIPPDKKVPVGPTLLWCAIEACALGKVARRIVQWLVEQGLREVEFGKHGKRLPYGPLHHAAFAGDESMIQLLCALGFSVVERAGERHPWTLLHMLAQNPNANMNMVDALVQAGANPLALNKRGTDLRTVVSGMPTIPFKKTWLELL